MAKNYDYYCEFDNLFVEWEFDRNDCIDIINVQMYPPEKKDDTEKWIDLTDMVSASPAFHACILGQIEDQYVDVSYE